MKFVDLREYSKKIDFGYIIVTGSGNKLLAVKEPKEKFSNIRLINIETCEVEHTFCSFIDVEKSLVIKHIIPAKKVEMVVKD